VEISPLHYDSSSRDGLNCLLQVIVLAVQFGVACFLLKDVDLLGPEIIWNKLIEDKN
jgi:hypothetical protein